MFLVNNEKEGAQARLLDLKMVNSNDENEVQSQLKDFLREHVSNSQQIDLFLLGENGDSRLLKYYNACETAVSANTCIGRFKHAFGEFQTVSALALWLACHAIQHQKIPAHFIKHGSPSVLNRILIYNNYQGLQHGFLLIEKV